MIHNHHKQLLNMRNMSAFLLLLLYMIRFGLGMKITQN